MFFPKLRRRAKWVFLFLAIAFAGSFVFFGVGAGGSGIGDYLSDLLNRPISTEGPSLGDAREAVAENPTDAEAQLDLARAAQREGEIDESIAAFERYRTIADPVDDGALRTLAALYGQRIAEAQQRASVAQAVAEEASLPRSFAPDDSPFLQELTGNPISDAASGRAQQRATVANEEAQRLGVLQVAVLTELTEVVDDEPLLFLQFAQAAENAQDYETAITGYERFLELAPNHPSAEQVTQRIELLEAFAGLGDITGGAGTGDEETGDSDGG